MKATFHKSCSCRSCMRGRKHTNDMRNNNERKLRQTSRVALANVVKGDEDAVIVPITSPYTD